MYEPSDDTFLLADYIRDIKGERALDLCTGKGYIAYILSNNFKEVVAIDIDLNSLLNARKKDNILYICSNSPSCLNTKFDLITMNPPYLPSDKIEDIAIDGGKEGIEVTADMISKCIDLMHKDSRMLIVGSTLSSIDKLKFDQLEIRIAKRKRLWFEELVLLEARLCM